MTRVHAGDGLLGEEEIVVLTGRPPAHSASASFRAAMRAANSAYSGRPSGATHCCAASRLQHAQVTLLLLLYPYCCCIFMSPTASILGSGNRVLLHCDSA